MLLPAFGVYCYFLHAQKVTKKGTTNTNRLLDLVAHAHTTKLINLAVRTVRGRATHKRF
ncbi:MAG: hypothetical protein ACKOYC_08285 [Bacteroidota bacterium]